MKFNIALLLLGLTLILSCTHVQPKTAPSLAILRQTLKLKLKDKKAFFQKIGYQFSRGDSTSLSYKHVDERDTSYYRLTDAKMLKGCAYTTNNKNELVLLVKEALASGFKQKINENGHTMYTNGAEILFITNIVGKGKRLLKVSLMQAGMPK